MHLTCHSTNIHLLPLAVLTDRVDIFRRMNMTSPTTLGAVTTTI